ncbi:MAG: glycosyltransferase [Flavobacteriales bacterium]|nr:glycosyltransferase [Flavobacteriales bacterium]
MSNVEVLQQIAGTGSMIINSSVETFSVVTGEALALGKPVIATRCGGPVAFISEVNGVLIEPRDEAALTAAMVDRLNGVVSYDPAVIRASVSENFSVEAVGGRFLEIYRDALGHG